MAIQFKEQAEEMAKESEIDSLEKFESALTITQELIFEMRREQLDKMQAKPFEGIEQTETENEGSYGSQKLACSSDPWNQQIRAFTFT